MYFLQGNLLDPGPFDQPLLLEKGHKENFRRGKTLIPPKNMSELHPWSVELSIIIVTWLVFLERSKLINTL